MGTAQVLHRLPSLRPELQHLLIVAVGAAHTLLCAGKSQLNEAPAGLLQLQWTWSVHDVLAVVNIMTIGAIFASSAHSGNEPTFCASFAAGECRGTHPQYHVHAHRGTARSTTAGRDT